MVVTNTVAVLAGGAGAVTHHQGIHGIHHREGDGEGKVIVN